MEVRRFLQTKFSKSLYQSAYSRAFYSLFGTVTQEIRVAFKQFYSRHYPIRTLFRVFAVIASSVFHLFLGRSLKYSFAFTGEDRAIEGILKPIITHSGTYVDVGCNHPKFLSNTYGLYRKGWNGICIDANAELIKKYKYYRPRDVAVHALVSSVVGQRTFYLSENEVLSTVEKSNLIHVDHENLQHKTIEMNTQTLTSILDEYNFEKEFDVLSVDVEEHDFSVLTSLDFSRYIPKLIIVEDEIFDFSKIGENPINNYLTQYRYELKGYILKNLYFMKKE
jgi:FkbM family methyltransferase